MSPELMIVQVPKRFGAAAYMLSSVFPIMQEKLRMLGWGCFPIFWSGCFLEVYSTHV